MNFLKGTLGLLKTIIGIALIVGIVVGAACLYATYGIKDVVLKTNEGNRIKEVTVTSVLDKLKMDIYSMQLNPINEGKEKNIKIDNDIEIKYDTTTIRIDLDQKDYCQYQNPNFTSNSKMPNGLYEWAKSMVQ